MNSMQLNINMLNNYLRNINDFKYIDNQYLLRFIFL